MTRRRLRLEHRALQIDVHHVVELFLADFFRFLFAVESHAIHEDVEPPEPPDDIVYQTARFRYRRRLESRAMCIVPAFPEPFGTGCGFVRVMPGHSHLGARIAESIAHSLTNAAVATGDEGDLAVQIERICDTHLATIR